jgi:hypothetical protein
MTRLAVPSAGAWCFGWGPWPAYRDAWERGYGAHHGRTPPPCREGKRGRAAAWEGKRRVVAGALERWERGHSEGGLGNKEENEELP